MGKNMQKIEVQGTEISVNLSREEDYISLTDMLMPKLATSLSPTGCATGIRWSIWVFGNVSIIRILIMANSP